ncbi:hypothetical protein LCGC14_0358070 [marine sediment metagenome]|uniref:Uncharacterized protein n=1 Tax=marine sediment metagenome TaxID=412755 RepID=A0A0F9VW39_9ZZZZ
MSMTQAEKQAAYRARKSNKVTPPIVTSVTEGVLPADSVLDPLDVYSESRWTYLQSRGYVWFPSLQRGRKSDHTLGVVVPGDPAYEGDGTGQCRTCGGPVQHPKVVKCIKCCTANSKPAIQHDNSACSGSPKPTFADLPTDVQASIDKHCAENNNGQRAGSHSRAAMTERALHYQGVTAV